ncbi:DUF6207 family protein [Streptomyces sp. NPDC055210]
MNHRNRPPADSRCPNREPGEPGVRLRCFLDIRQEPDTQRRPRAGR